MGILSVAAGLIGLLLVLRGWVGRRVGDEPRCRKCDYELTGIGSEKCPECGWIIDPMSVRRGHRVRRGRALVGGLILVAISAALSVGFLSKVNWRSYYPTSFLVWCAEFGDDASLNEVANRQAQGTLTSSQITMIAEKCLAKQKTSSKTKNAKDWPWLALLADFDASESLTRDQRNQYYSQAISDISLEVRRPSRSQRPFPVRVKFWWASAYPIRKASQPLYSYCSDMDYHMDTYSLLDYAFPQDQRIHLRRQQSSIPSNAGGTGWRSRGDILVFDSPGRHVLTASGDIVIKRFNRGEGELYRKHFDVSVEVETVPSGSDDPVRVVAEPRDPDSLKDLLEPKSAGRSPLVGFVQFATADEQFSRSSLLMGTRRPLPVNIAYDVLLDTESGTKGIGTLLGEQGSCAPELKIERDPSQKLGRIRKLILRPSADLARETVGMHEISSHELIFDLPKFAGIPAISQPTSRSVSDSDS